MKDTVWWNTPGGKVMEHGDANGASCSLMLYNDAGSVVFDWGGPGRILVTAVDRSWHFPEDLKMPVAIQLGDEWLSNGGDSAIIQAVGHGNAVGFAVNKPIDNLLSAARHIEIRTKDAALSITLNPAKMDVLLSRVFLCRDAIKR